MSRGRRTKRTSRPAVHPPRDAVKELPRGVPDDRASRPLSRRLPWLLGLVAITVIAYAPVWHYDFVSFDDFIYVTDNAHVRAGLSWSGAAWAFTSSYANFWHPLTWLSLMLDVQWYGVNAGMLHVTNVLLHLASTLLLFLIMHRMTGAPGRSAFVAALFAVHPLHVESVAWIAERKDALSTVFWMLTVWAYLGYVRTPRWHRYLLVAVLFALGLMAKPMLVTLPFVLLLLDVWPLGRIGAGLPGRAWLPLVCEKVPLFVLALAASIIAFITQRSGGAVAALDAFPLADRIANALAAFVTYPARMVWPIRLVPFYPHPQTIRFWPAVGGLFVLVVVSALVTRAIPRRPHLAVGWFWFVGTLIPVVGLIQVGSHATADRYTYVPLIGLFIIAAWGVFDLFGARRLRQVILPAAACVVVAASIVTTRAQVMTWKDSATLWQHALDVMPDNFCAHYGLGKLLDAQGRHEESVRHLRESIRLAPRFADARVALGRALAVQGRMDEAIDQYVEALRLAPASRDARANLGLVLEQSGRFPEAAVQYREALAAAPEDVEVRNSLGHALASQGKIAEAIAEFSEALRLRPDDAPARANLADALAAQGKISEAIPLFRDALRLQPGYAPAHENLGRALASQGKLPEAISELSEALRLAPDSVDAHTWLASALASTGRIDDAIAHYGEALRLRPDRADIHDALGFLLAGRGKTADAIAHFSEAVRLEPSETAHLYLGIALAGTGEYEKGEAHLNEALRLNPKNDAARRALDDLSRRRRSAR
jgi:tetratricopeptide (TPR) repeat protein